jgi:hypothetical protein
MSDVQGHKVITLRPGDSVTYEWAASPCSSRVANDGTIPYGTNVSSVAVTAYKGKEVATSDIVVQSSVAANIVQAELKYPVSNGGGKYQLRFALTLDNGEVVNKRFDELYAKEDAS